MRGNLPHESSVREDDLTQGEAIPPLLFSERKYMWLLMKHEEGDVQVVPKYDVFKIQLVDETYSVHAKIKTYTRLTQFEEVREISDKVIEDFNNRQIEKCFQT